MPIYQVSAGDRILAADLNAYYSLLKGAAGSGETITLAHNAAGTLAFQPQTNPASETEFLQIKNAAGAVQGAFTSDGKLRHAAGTAAAPSITFSGATTHGLFQSGATVGITISGAKVGEFGTTYLSIGTSPATAGALRLPNNDTIQFRNAANTANVEAVSVNASNQISFAGGGMILGTGFLSLPTGGAVALTGLFRTPNGQYWNSRNAANTGDLIVIGMGSDNVVQIGDNAGSGVSIPAGLLSIGTNPSTTGLIRAPSNSTIGVRNAANTANFVVLRLGDASDRISLWDSNQSAEALIRGAAFDAGGHGAASTRYWTQV